MSQPRRILLDDESLWWLRPLSRFRSIFDYERCRTTLLDDLRQSDAAIHYAHPDPLYRAAICRLYQISECDDTSRQSGNFDAVIKSSDIDPVHHPERISRRVEEECRRSRDQSNARAADDDYRLSAARLATQRFELIGSASDLYLHPSAEVLPGAIFDTRSGPILIDRDCSISPFSYLAGPIVASAGCRLDNLRLGGGAILGYGCRLGGEIEMSILGDFSNKHHEGFLGHSLVGHWVNLGALTTTSDLKNNYGEVRLRQPGSEASDEKLCHTNRIKLGSILGESVKTAIGTMLNTGSVIDAGCNLFGGTPPGYLPPLSWGLDGRRYDKERFLRDYTIIAARRKQQQHSELATLLSLI